MWKNRLYWFVGFIQSKKTHSRLRPPFLKNREVGSDVPTPLPPLQSTCPFSISRIVGPQRDGGVRGVRQARELDQQGLHRRQHPPHALRTPPSPTLKHKYYKYIDLLQNRKKFGLEEGVWKNTFRFSKLFTKSVLSLSSLPLVPFLSFPFLFLFFFMF